MLRKKLNLFTSQVHKEMTPGNKRLHFEHAHNLKASFEQNNVNIFGDGPGRNLKTGLEIDKEVTCTEDAGNERCKARLKTGTKKKKKTLNLYQF